MKPGLLILVLCTAVLVACSNTSSKQDDEPSVILGTLHRVDARGAAIAYRDPNADLSQYTRLLLDPLDLDNVNIIQPNRSVSTRQKWELDDATRERLQAAFREVFMRELEQGGYEVSDKEGHDVLRITASVIAIAPSASQDNFRSRPVGRSRVYTEGAGTMSIAFGFSDSTSGEILAVVKDSRRGSPMWGANTSVSNMSDVRFMFGGWARQIVARLDIIHGF